MKSYLYPIEKALIQFPVIALVLTIPFILYNYRRYGSVSFVRSLVLFTFIFYLQCAFYMVILPLPEPNVVVNNTGPFVQLIPFNFIKDFINYTSFDYRDLSTIFIAIKENVFTQPIFNIFLTIPFGVYLGYYFKQDVRKVIIYSLLLSLFFEVTQITGIFGFYPKPYRLFDIDDIILNVFGGVVGCLIHKGVILFLPSRDDIDKNNLKKSAKVGYLRRSVGVIIDIIVVVIGIIFIRRFVFLDNHNILVIFFLYFVIVPSVFRGKTIGKKFVNLKLSTVDSNVSLFIHLIVRYGLVYFFIVVMQKLMFLDVLLIVMVSFIITDILLSLKRHKRLSYEVLSKTEYKSEKYYIELD